MKGVRGTKNAIKPYDTTSEGRNDTQVGTQVGGNSVISYTIADL